MMKLSNHYKELIWDWGWHLLVLVVIMLFIYPTSPNAVSVSREEYNNLVRRITELESRISRQERKGGQNFDGDGVLQTSLASGSPVGSFDREFHKTSSTSTMVAGVSTVNISSSVTTTRSDMSFRNVSSYSVSISSMSESNTNRYSVYKVSGTQFKIYSSDVNDTFTVKYEARGE